MSSQVLSSRKRARSAEFRRPFGAQAYFGVRVEDGPVLVAGQPYTTTLQQFRAILLANVSGIEAVSYSGTRVTSTKPVAVFAGNNIFDTEIKDALFEQIPSADKLGRSYLVRKPARRTEERVRFVAAYDGTEVRIDGAVYALLNATDFADFLISASDSSPHSITASSPLLVSYATVYSAKLSGQAILAVVPPLEQLATSVFGFTEFTPNRSILPSVDFDDVHLRAVGERGFGAAEWVSGRVAMGSRTHLRPLGCRSVFTASTP
ncbi:MAG: IgGFc-binding protein [Deltaproteobacteria bacterium]|nr:IgGFc-binding protein [Deltaproteobacteria bacterium]